MHPDWLTSTCVAQERDENYSFCTVIKRARYVRHFMGKNIAIYGGEPFTYFLTKRTVLLSVSNYTLTKLVHQEITLLSVKKSVT